MDGLGLPRDNFRPVVAVSPLPVVIGTTVGLTFGCFGAGVSTGGARSSMVLDLRKLCLLRQKGKRSKRLTVDLMDMLSATTGFDLPVKRMLKKVKYLNFLVLCSAKYVLRFVCELRDRVPAP